MLLEALQALPSRGCQQQISSFKHCRSGELFMIASGKRRPAFSAKHGRFTHALFPGSTRYTLTHSWSGTHRLFSVHCGPSKKNALIFIKTFWASLLIWSYLRKSRARHFRHPALSGWRLHLKDGVKGQFTKSGEMPLTAVIQK